MNEKIKIAGFDADDTLWINENIFRNAEKQFCLMMKDYGNEEFITRELFSVEMKNLPLYGYGIKAFMLSVIETALKLSNNKVDQEIISKIISNGRQMMSEPVILLEGVENTIKTLSARYKIIVVTKGDLLDQQRKLNKSGVGKYLHHIEVMSEKTPHGYSRLLEHLQIKPEEFVMIGNSLKSDILPVLSIGGSAIHVPYQITWQHEEVAPEKLKDKNFTTVTKIEEILKIL